jgi:hypothetical protein
MWNKKKRRVDYSGLWLSFGQIRSAFVRERREEMRKEL